MPAVDDQLSVVNFHLNFIGGEVLSIQGHFEFVVCVGELKYRSFVISLGYLSRTHSNDSVVVLQGPVPLRVTGQLDLGHFGGL